MRAAILATLVLTAALLAGCSKENAAPAAGTEAVPHHEHHPPHGGAPVELGHEEYHVELVRDAARGVLQAYVLDGELENFVRIAADSLTIIARPNGREETLELKAVPNAATGEKVGDTSLFEAQADWLKTTGDFDGALAKITVRGSVYTNVAFNFPKGSDEGAKK